MKKIKTQKGITLIALIITIVVLLILAVVAIGAVRDSNIVGYAQNAAGGYNQAKANEIGALTSYEETINKYAPKKELSAEEKEEIAELVIQYWMNRDEATKKTLFDKGVDLNSLISVEDESYNSYFYIKNNQDILMLVGEDENGQLICSIVDKNNIPVLNDLYEIAVIANQEVKTKTSSSDDFIIEYKGETIVGQWQAQPWCFEYKGYIIWYSYYDGNEDNLSSIRYVGI